MELRTFTLDELCSSPPAHPPRREYPHFEGIRMLTTPPAMSHRGACRAAAARQPFQALRASEADIRRLSPHRLTPCDGFAV